MKLAFFLVTFLITGQHALAQSVEAAFEAEGVYVKQTYSEFENPYTFAEFAAEDSAKASCAIQSKDFGRISNWTYTILSEKPYTVSAKAFFICTK